MSTTPPLPRVDLKYLTLRSECEKLLEIAKQLERLANSNTACAGDPQFDEAKKRFRNQFQYLVGVQGSVV